MTRGGGNIFPELPLRLNARLLSEDNEDVNKTNRRRALRLCNNGSNFELKLLFVGDDFRAEIRCRKRVIDGLCLCVLLNVCLCLVSPMKCAWCVVVLLVTRSR